MAQCCRELSPGADEPRRASRWLRPIIARRAALTIAQGWTSSLIASLAHIARITVVGANHVYIAQENDNGRQYFLALPLLHTARAMPSPTVSGVAGRIVRGWIHFTIEGA